MRAEEHRIPPCMDWLRGLWRAYDVNRGLWVIEAEELDVCGDLAARLSIIKDSTVMTVHRGSLVSEEGANTAIYMAALDNQHIS